MSDGYSQLVTNRNKWVAIKDRHPIGSSSRHKATLMLDSIRGQLKQHMRKQYYDKQKPTTNT